MNLRASGSATNDAGVSLGDIGRPPPLSLRVPVWCSLIGATAIRLHARTAVPPSDGVISRTLLAHCLRRCRSCRAPVCDWMSPCPLTTCIGPVLMIAARIMRQSRSPGVIQTPRIRAASKSSGVSKSHFNNTGFPSALGSPRSYCTRLARQAKRSIQSATSAPGAPDVARAGRSAAPAAVGSRKVLEGLEGAATSHHRRFDLSHPTVAYHGCIFASSDIKRQQRNEWALFPAFSSTR
jgi:hypothetical protein